MTSAENKYNFTINSKDFKFFFTGTRYVATRIRKVIAEEIPARVTADAACRNAMKNNDKKTARIEHNASQLLVFLDLAKKFTF